MGTSTQKTLHCKLLQQQPKKENNFITNFNKQKPPKKTKKTFIANFYTKKLHCKLLHLPKSKKRLHYKLLHKKNLHYKLQQTKTPKKKQKKPSLQTSTQKNFIANFY